MKLTAELVGDPCDGAKRAVEDATNVLYVEYIVREILGGPPVRHGMHRYLRRRGSFKYPLPFDHAGSKPCP